MEALIARPAMEDGKLTGVIVREWPKLWRFIRRRVADDEDAQDILQEVFSEFIEAIRFLAPIEQVGAWLYRVARNRIIDRFRKKTSTPFSQILPSDEGEGVSFEELLPSVDGGPDAQYLRSVLIEELEAALDELPEEQRTVFLAHELEGRTFKELAAETGTSINTLLARKRYAVRHLRRRLRNIYDEFR
jgi:RNA polymerase sigma factor (sigma-70 family)